MPLTALSPSGVLDTTNITDEAWAAVYRPRTRASLACCECGASMHAKKSSAGLRFFAHDAVAECSTATETPAHRQLKHMLATAVRDAGWSAEVEAASTPVDRGVWRADVLAISPSGDRRIAIEAQLAPQTADDTVFRTERYAADGVETLWVTTRSASWLWKVPGIRIDARAADVSSTAQVAAGIARYDNGVWTATSAPVDEAVAAILNGAATVAGADRVLPVAAGAYSGVRPVAVQATVWASSQSIARHAADVHAKREAERAAEHALRRNINRGALRSVAYKNRKLWERARWHRQQQLLGPALDDIFADLAPGASVFVGTGRTPVQYAADNVPIAFAQGGPDQAHGAPIWIGADASSAELVAVLEPDTRRLPNKVIRAWRRAGVRVYVVDTTEARRVTWRLTRVPSGEAPRIVVPPRLAAP